MFCERCGAELGPEGRLCAVCEKWEREEADRFHGKAEKTPSLGLAPKDPEKPKRKKSRTDIVAAGVTAALALAAVGAVAFLSPVIGEPELNEEKLLADIGADRMAAEGYTNSQWASNDGYAVTSTSIVENEKIDPPTGGGPFAATGVGSGCPGKRKFSRDDSRVELLSLNDKREWQIVEGAQDSATIEPLRGVSEESLMAKAPEFMRSVDKDPQRDVNGKELKLVDLYSDGAVFKVVENNTNAQGGSAQITMSKKAGLYACNGTLTVDFAFNGIDWEVVGCSADEKAYEKDYSAMVGERTASFLGTEGINRSVRHCYGGRTSPLVLNVKSYEPSGATVTADISFVVHNHLDPDSAADQCEGDGVYTAENVIIPFKFADQFYKVFERDDVQGAADITVFFSLAANSSVVKVKVEDSYWPGGGDVGHVF